MSTDRANDLRAFRSFLDERFPAEGTLDEALARWDYENQSEEERADALRAIREGFDDLDVGRTEPAREVLGELRRKYGSSGR